MSLEKIFYTRPLFHQSNGIDVYFFRIRVSRENESRFKQNGNNLRRTFSRIIKKALEQSAIYYFCDAFLIYSNDRFRGKVNNAQSRPGINSRS